LHGTFPFKFVVIAKYSIINLNSLFQHLHSETLKLKIENVTI